MRARIARADERLRFDNGRIYVGDCVYDMDKLTALLVQISDLTFVEDTVRLLLEFGDSALIVPSGHSDYDALFEKLREAVKIDNDAYLRAMNCERTCDFLLYGKRD